jgi:acetyltransferase-like isoleucine patch superfamily enzyme
MKNIIDEQEFMKLHPDALIRSGTVIYDGSSFGSHFTTGHNAVIREDNSIGDNVVVGVNTYLGPRNTIGDNVKIHTGCFLEGVTLGNDVIIAPHAVFTNDPYPPCKQCAEEIGGAIVGEGTVIGANATILPGVRIGKRCLIGAGSVVTRDIEDGGVVVGNPGRVIKKRSDIIHNHTAS